MEDTTYAIEEADADELRRMQNRRPDLGIVAILPWSPEDGPYMRTFKLVNDQIAILRVPRPLDAEWTEG